MHIFKLFTFSNAILRLKMYISIIHCKKFMGKRSAKTSSMIPKFHLPFQLKLHFM